MKWFLCGTSVPLPSTKWVRVVVNSKQRHQKIPTTTKNSGEETLADGEKQECYLGAMKPPC